MKNSPRSPPLVCAHEGLEGSPLDVSRCAGQRDALQGRDGIRQTVRLQLQDLGWFEYVTVFLFDTVKESCDPTNEGRRVTFSDRRELLVCDAEFALLLARLLIHQFQEEQF